jgi:hypothetical protein
MLNLSQGRVVGTDVQLMHDVQLCAMYSDLDIGFTTAQTCPMLQPISVPFS